MRANAWLRDNTPLNLGHFAFYPIHKGLGGRIRYLISGGSALSEKVQKDFHGLGFTILEGYGLTEASPVLTVTRPRNSMLAGSVGKPLPGIEIKIAEADASGIGEVIARGPNVMVGYYENEAATRETLVKRWLHTGDLGRLMMTATCIWSVARKTSSLIPTARTFTPTSWKRLTTARLSSKS